MEPQQNDKSSQKCTKCTGYKKSTLTFKSMSYVYQDIDKNARQFIDNPQAIPKSLLYLSSILVFYCGTICGISLSSFF